MSQGKPCLQTNLFILSLVTEQNPSVPCLLPWTSPFQGTPAGFLPGVSPRPQKAVVLVPRTQGKLDVLEGLDPWERPWTKTDGVGL